MHILLIEDNPHEVFFVQHALKQVTQPVTLSVMQDGAQALAFLFHQEPYTQAERPDIILLDINMPYQSGFDVLAALEHDPHLKFIPVIILTTSSHPDDIDRCYELGANAYLTKPLGLDELYALIRTTVEF
jgi:chemotaxis family two-component system response regulator Rcp1